MILQRLSRSIARKSRPPYLPIAQKRLQSSSSDLKKLDELTEIEKTRAPLDAQDPLVLEKIEILKEKLAEQTKLIKKQADKESDAEIREKIIEQRLEDYIPPLNVDDDSVDGLFDEEHLDVVNAYLKKVYSNHELFIKDLELNHIESYKQRTFYKMVRLFQEETGQTKRGYVEFTSALLYNLHKFEVNQHIDAYRVLLECFPQSPHTGIRRARFSVIDGPSMSGERFADHELAMVILRQMFEEGLMPDNNMREFVIQIFGKNSQAYVTLDNAMFWNPRFAGYNLRYDYNAYVTPYDPPNILKDPVEASFKALRQMVPGIYTEMHRFPINENLEQQLIQLKKNNEAEIVKERPSPYEVKQMRQSVDRKAFSNAIISVQSEDMLNSIDNHDEKLPIIMSGPHVVYVQGKGIKYYCMESAVGGDFEMQMYEDPDQYKMIEYEKWWKSDVDHKKILWDAETDLGKLNAIDQRVLPSLDRAKGQIEKDLLWDGHSQLEEIDQFEDAFDSPIYAIATFGTDGTEAALLNWIKNLALTKKENFNAFKNAPIVFKKSMLKSENINIDPDFQESTLVNFDDVEDDCFLGTAPEIMPRMEEIVSRGVMMTGVDMEYDHEERKKWGDGVNAEFFDEWSYHIPYKKYSNIGGRGALG